MKDDVVVIYYVAYGLARSGVNLAAGDVTEPDEAVAFALGVSDGKTNTALKSTASLKSEIERILGCSI